MRRTGILQSLGNKKRQSWKVTKECFRETKDVVLGSPESAVILLYSVPIITFVSFQGDFQQLKE